MSNKQSSTKNHDLFSDPSLTGRAIHFAARMINYKLLNPALFRILTQGSNYSNMSTTFVF